MIQRIQSVWLLIATLASFLTLKLSFYSGTLLSDNQYHVLNGTENLTVIIPTIALGVVCLITIFLFKNRSTQLKLSIVGILIDFLLLYLYLVHTKDFTTGEYAFTAILHPIVIGALALAARGINKDEKLIRDSNRLR